MKIMKSLMVIPITAAFFAAPLAHDAHAAVFVSAGVAPVYYPAPAYYAPPPAAYAPPAYPAYVAPAPAVVYAAPAVVSPVFVGFGGYGYHHWHGYGHYWH